MNGLGGAHHRAVNCFTLGKVRSHVAVGEATKVAAIKDASASHPIELVE